MEMFCQSAILFPFMGIFTYPKKESSPYSEISTLIQTLMLCIYAGVLQNSKILACNRL